MENIESRKKAYKALLIIISVILIAGAILQIYWFTTEGISFGSIMSLIGYLAPLYYILIGYKKPHGNTMKWVFIIFAIVLVVYAITETTEGIGYGAGLAAVLVAFMGGRLNKLADVTALSFVVLVLLLGAGLAANATVQPSFSEWYKFSGAVQWIGIAGSYFYRYYEHKEAGLIDRVKTVAEKVNG